ncbi:MAG: hypothetical protein GX791_05620 [Synergistaceae bacterium]|nr:hypothetical protein [Synergistaceae bacterium]
MKIDTENTGKIRPSEVPAERDEKAEEGKKKLEKARGALQRDRLEMMDRHHETVKKSAQLYDKQVQKELLEKDREKRLLLQREFHSERTALDEIKRKARMKAEG